MKDSPFSRFTKLPPASTPGQFEAIGLSDVRNDFLAKTIDGAPVVLVQDSSTPRYRPGFQLKYFKADFHTTCLIQSDRGEVKGQFAIISCDPTATELHEMFVRSVMATVSDLPTAAGTDDIQSRFQKMADLFRRFSAPGGRQLSGLWAELFVIARSKDIPAALRAWRSGPSERFDFSWARTQLEVKATTRPIRAHEFALEQLRTPEHGKTFVSSLLLQQLTGGTGVMDLASSIEEHIGGSSDLRQKLWNNIAADLGNDFSEAIDKQFDVSYAVRNAVLFMADDIPAPRFEEDPRITSLRFVSDLTSVLPTAAGVALENLFL